MVTLCFVPFLIWGVLVSVGQQSSFSSCKQLGSYASWILLLIAGCALFDRPEDFSKLRSVGVLSVVSSALGGVIEALLGHAPMIGLPWENMGFTRIHTGGGGIMLDACTPYIAALLLLASSAKRPLLLVSGILLALWGSGNILRGGMIGFSLAMVWLMIATRGASRLSEARKAPPRTIGMRNVSKKSRETWLKNTVGSRVHKASRYRPIIHSVIGRSAAVEIWCAP